MLSENRGTSLFSWSTILRVVNDWSDYIYISDFLSSLENDLSSPQLYFNHKLSLFIFFFYLKLYFESWVATDLDNMFSFFKPSSLFVYLLFACSNLVISIMQERSFGICFTCNPCVTKRWLWYCYARKQIIWVTSIQCLLNNTLSFPLFSFYVILNDLYLGWTSILHWGSTRWKWSCRTLTKPPVWENWATEC